MRLMNVSILVLLLVGFFFTWGKKAFTFISERPSSVLSTSNAGTSALRGNQSNTVPEKNPMLDPWANSVLLQGLEYQESSLNAHYLTVASVSSEGPIKVNGDNFYQVLNQVYYGSEKDKMLGKRLNLSGMFFKDADSFYSNQAYLGRYVMFCCASDTSIAGFFIEGKLKAFKKEQWVSATGTIQLKATPQGKLPVVVLDQLEKAAEEDPFIYPSMDGSTSSKPSAKSPSI